MRPLGPAGLAALLVLAGCGGGNDASTPSSTSAAPTSPSPAPPAPVTSSEVTGGPTSTTPGSLRPPTSSAPGTTPQGFGTVSVLVDSVTELCLWLAATASERQQGLMGVTSLGGAEGMLFDFGATTTGEFWMFQTLLPLSIAFYDAEGAFVSSTDMDPCAGANGGECPRYGAAAPYAYAVETPQGDLEDLGLVRGSRIELGPACPAG